MDVFDGIAINGLTIKNRFVRSAVWEGMAADDGAVTPNLINLMKNLAEGGTGLLISSFAYIQKNGKSHHGQLGIYDDALIPGLREMCGEVHKAGASIFAQIVHGGVNADESRLELLCPSEMTTARGEKASAMTEGDIALWVEGFAHAARRAVSAGFDGVQIHGAHAYGLAQFLSPYYNRRTDRYGSTIENRARALIEVYRAVRNVVGENYPVTAKINSEDFIDGGVTPGMMVETAVIMESEGFDAVELSGGGGPAARYLASRPGDFKTPDEEVYYREAALLYKKYVKKMPLMLVGGIRSLEVARQLLRDGLADMISFGRPLVREPALVNRWASGDTSRAACVSCEGCRKPALAGEGIRCIRL